jgi:DNA-binding NarL/FixJ family response regulator
MGWRSRRRGTLAPVRCPICRRRFARASGCPEHGAIAGARAPPTRPELGGLGGLALGGFELIARLRDDARFSATPIVVITSRASPEHRRRARELGVRALVAKPITRRKLLEALTAR